MNWLISFVIRIYTNITCKIDGSDLSKVPAKGPLILISNHTGQIEAPLLYAHLQPRPLSGWAKAEAWDNWFLRWIFTTWNMIPVRRGEADMNALKAALRVLENGAIFGIAPEGTRNRSGKLRRALPGAVIVALHSGVPILPIAHWGGENFLKNFLHLKRTDFHIRVGEPFKLNIAGKKVSNEERQLLVDEMMVQIAILLPEEYRGEYAEMSRQSTPHITKLESGS
jgi:1-acyl-sn-glycerol-3-phosphate acyltransferase